MEVSTRLQDALKKELVKSSKETVVAFDPILSYSKNGEIKTISLLTNDEEAFREWVFFTYPLLPLQLKSFDKMQREEIFQIASDGRSVFACFFKPLTFKQPIIGNN
jgi:hypothetical protein